MDETSMAFELPHVRASATHDGPPLDRISVRDYVRCADIGAFRSEHGVSQRLRFNVVLEVSHHAAAENDDVDQIISYDSITEAIDHALESERVDLLETLSERVARGSLADPRAVRVFVRIEKLDRIPGSLGVEIVRTRARDNVPLLREVSGPQHQYREAVPLIVHLTREVMHCERLVYWLDVVASACRPVIICLDPAEAQELAARESMRRIGLLAIEQAAWWLVDRDPRFEVIETRTELDWALKHGHLPVWAPSRMVTASRHPPAADASDPAALSLWLARETSADGVVLVGSNSGPGDSPDGLVVVSVDAVGPEILEAAT